MCLGDIVLELSFRKSMLSTLKKIPTPTSSTTVYHKQQYYLHKQKHVNKNENTIV